MGPARAVDREAVATGQGARWSGIVRPVIENPESEEGMGEVLLGRIQVRSRDLMRNHPCSKAVCAETDAKVAWYFVETYRWVGFHTSMGNGSHPLATLA